jgi:glycosyltransferase involved in cell wall biosynthesis
VVRNARATLERTIRSVLAQRGPELDYLVVDGASTDGTLDVIRAHEARLRWISEPDRGLYDAMNKGVGRVADPERYVMFLNADDTLAGENALDRLMAGGRGEDLLYGRLELHDEALDYRQVVGRELDARGLLTGMIPHQALAARRGVFDRVGDFDLRYRIAADYDWLTRAYQCAGITRRFVPEVVAVMAGGGLSERLYTRLLRERWDVVRRRRPPLDLAVWTAVALLSELPRHVARRALRRLGMLNLARGLGRRRRGGSSPAGAPRS